MKLRTIRNQVSVVPQLTKNRGVRPTNIVKPKRGRSLKKPLESQLKPKLRSPRVLKKRRSKILRAIPSKVPSQNDSDGLVSFNHSGYSDQYHEASEILNQSIILFNEKKAQPYHASVNTQLGKIKDIMDRTKTFLDKLQMEREPKSQPKPLSLPIPKPRPKFDPFLAPYTESLFSASAPVDTAPGPSTSANMLQSTYSFFNDSNVPLAQKDPNRSLMEYDQIMETSYNPGSSFNSEGISPRGLFNSNSNVEFDKSLSFAYKMDEDKTFFGTENQAVFGAGAQESLEKDVSEYQPASQSEDDNYLLCRSYQQCGQNMFASEVANQTNGSFQSEFAATDQKAVKRLHMDDNDQRMIENSNLEPDKPELAEDQPQLPTGKLFSPIHLQLLAKRLHLNENFLK